eukprot:1142382-Pelagomonas_calceolata.AAC.2
MPGSRQQSLCTAAITQHAVVNHVMQMHLYTSTGPAALDTHLHTSSHLAPSYPSKRFQQSMH